MKRLLFLFLFSTATAHAFIPSGDYLLEKVSKTHGKGNYTIEQELTFRNENETVLLKEQWLVQDGESMSLTVKGGTVNLRFVFNNGKVFYEDNGQVVSRKQNIESLERYFHVRGDKTLADLLVSAKVVNPNSVRAKAKPRSLQNIKYDADPFMRLMRLGEDTAYLISSTQTSQESSLQPGIWIDQSDNSIRKIRFTSQAEVAANGYQSFANELLFPRQRVVTWNQQSVEIRLLKLNGAGKSATLDAELAPGAVAKQPLSYGTSALKEQIREFYQRFR